MSTVSQTGATVSKTYVLRGYVRQLENGKFQGICLSVNLLVESNSFEGAKKSLDALIKAYVEDAIKDGDLDAAMSRPAHWHHYAEFYWLSVLHRLHILNSAFCRFTESRPIPMHA